MEAPVRVSEFEPGQAAAWDEYVRRHPHGSPFHLTAWMRSITETFAYQPKCLVAATGDGRIRAVLPLFLVHNILAGRALISSPFAVYGGILADSAKAAEALAAHLRKLMDQLGADYAELRNAYPEQRAGFTPVSRYVTFTQRIGDSEDAILQAIPRKTRYMVRKALRHPYSSRPAVDPDTFFDLYSRSLRRLGTPCFPKRHFTTLLRNFGEEAEIREVLIGGQVVAAVMSFRFRDQILPYYGASDPAYHAMAPNNFMYFDLMRVAGRQGFHLFDFGRSKIQSGSHDFKAHWGMQRRELPYEMLLGKRKQLPDYSPNSPKFQLAIRLWRRLPLGVTRVLGPRLIRLVP